jgi:dihydrofolate synthase / folylpolyglutamate synthase
MPLRALPVPAADPVTRYLDRRPPSRAGGPRPTAPDRAARLLRALGDPHETFRAVHVAGTAGKGSATTFVAAVLTAHGFRVGAYLSPHACSVLERFRLDGRPVATEVAARPLGDVAPAVAAMDYRGGGGPTFFEVATALAFQIFAGEGVDYAVVETGLGGMLDATNTISRRDKIAVLTTIGLDHTEVLGSTLAEIAAQKAGILPREGRAFAARDRSARVVDVIAAEARRRRCELQLVNTAEYSRAASVGPDGTVLRMPGGPALPLGLHGRHQAGNAALVLRVVEALAERDQWEIDLDAVRAGLGRARLPGRFERRVWKGRPVVLDSAHNPIKIAAVVAALRDVHPGRRLPWVLALRQDKDLGGVLDAIAPVASVVVATEFCTDDGDHAAATSVPAVDIAAAARRAGLTAAVERDSWTALLNAAEWSAEPDPIVVAGSYHLLAALSDLEPAP